MARIVAERPGRDGAVPKPILRRVTRVTLSGYIGLVLLITQWPTPPDPYGPGWVRTVLDVLHDAGLPQSVDLALLEALANVAMFVPLGLLLPAATRWRPWVAVPAGAAFSTLIELSQLAFLPNRVPSIQDVVMNTLGAAVGAGVVLAVRAHARRRAATAGRVNEARHTDGRSSPAPATSIHGHGLPPGDDRLT